MAKKAVVVSLAVTAPLVCACVFSPALSIPLLPVLVAVVFLLSSAVGAWAFACVGAVYFAASLPLWGFNAITTGGAFVIAVLALPAAFASKLKPLVFIAVTAAVSVVAVAGFLGVTALIKGCGLQTLIVSSYCGLARDPAVRLLAVNAYSHLGASELGHTPLLPNDELYLTDAVSYYASTVGAELGDETVWFITGYGEFTGGICALCGFALCDCAAVKPRCLQYKAAHSLRLGREYFFAAVLPALAFALLALYQPMVPVVITVVNLMVTLPGCLNGITLAYHVATLPRGKIKILTMAAFWLIAALLALFYEWGMLIYGFVGLGDCVLDMRRLLNWALSP